MEKLGRYELIEPIAAGGMADVFLARPEGGSEVYALKRMRAALARDPELVRAFEDEARALERLNHPRIVRFVEAKTDGGSRYIVMEYVRGVDLRRVINECKRTSRYLSYDVVGQIADDVLSALRAVHEARGASGEPLGLVHRDISPSNLMLCADGAVKLTDFGIAKYADQGHHTHTGTIKGKTAYLAPEQVAGGTVDHRADLWSAAVVLYELVTLRHPVAGLSEADSFRRIRCQPIAPLNAWRRNVPDALDQVLRKALQRPPEERFQSAEVLRQAIRAALPQVNPADGPEALRLAFAGLFPEGAPRTDPDLPSGPSRAPMRPSRKRLLFAASLASGFALAWGGTELFHAAQRSARASTRPATAVAPGRFAPAPPSPVPAKPAAPPAVANSPPPLVVGAPRWEAERDAILTVEADRRAQVVIDGAPRGPPGDFALPPGPHRVALDGSRISVSLELRAGDVRRVRLTSVRARRR